MNSKTDTVAALIMVIDNSATSNGGRDATLHDFNCV